MRFRLRTLLTVLALGPLVIAAMVWGWEIFWDLWWVQVIR
jgi:hypothetical protein